MLYYFFKNSDMCTHHQALKYSQPFSADLIKLQKGFLTKIYGNKMSFSALFNREKRHQLELREV